MTQLTESERAQQKAYWAEHSSEATVEAMMLDSQAADIDKMERPEVGAGAPMFAFPHLFRPSFFSEAADISRQAVDHI